MNEVTAWLIDSTVDSIPHWYGGIEGYQHKWVTDANEAIWFSRKHDAERVAQALNLHEYQVTEHMFL